MMTSIKTVYNISSGCSKSEMEAQIEQVLKMIDPPNSFHPPRKAKSIKNNKLLAKLYLVLSLNLRNQDKKPKLQKRWKCLTPKFFLASQKKIRKITKLYLVLLPDARNQ